MKKFLSKTLNAFFVISASLILFSCSALDSDTRGGVLNFSISPSEFSDARNIILDSQSNSDVIYAVAYLTGDYTETKTLTFNSENIFQNEQKTFNFNSIPTGSSVAVEANVFTSDGEWLYYSEKSNLTIKSGENTLSITMKAINNDVQSTTYEGEATYMGLGIDNPGSAQVYLTIDYNGFYEVMPISMTTSYSKGKWSGNPANGGTIYLTEYLSTAFSDLDLSDPTTQVAYTNPNKTVITTNLKDIKFSVSSTGNFSFTLPSGIYCQK